MQNCIRTDINFKVFKLEYFTQNIKNLILVKDIYLILI